MKSTQVLVGSRLSRSVFAPARAAHRSEMSLGELPAVILDVVVACAGEEHGWRLEVTSAPPCGPHRDECCAVRLGRCRWMGGNGDRAEFRPEMAPRRGRVAAWPVLLLRPGGDGPTHMRLQQAANPGWAMATRQ